MSVQCRLLIILGALGVHCNLCLATCVFPHFLWKPVKDGVEQPRIWITEGRYDAQSDEASSQLEVTVRASELEARISHESRCMDFKGHSSPYACRHYEDDYTASCLHEPEEGKYMVEKFDKGRHLFSCIKFVQRNRHIVQLWEATPSEELDVDALCKDSALKRQAWPWIVQEAIEWSPCPQSLVGGYDFEIYDPFTKEPHCEGVWNPSRLEIDCVLGEGLVLTFATSSCSPLKDERTEISLQCMGHWLEEDYIFLLAAEPNKTSQFIFRFSSVPPVFDSPDVLATTVQFYTSPIAPLDRRGIPLDRIKQHLELKLRRSQSGMCYDEGAECADLVKDGKCSKGALFHASHCRRSCGLCELQPYNEPECRFKRYEKDWLLYNTQRTDRVSIAKSGYLTFSPLGTTMTSLGEYLCKTTHWEFDDYNVLSYYSNGCRPRYTCVRFEEDGHSTAKIQLSKSIRVYRPIDMCEFEDDPLPLGDLFRSAAPKILWQASKTKHQHCGIHGVVEVTVRGQMGIDCSGKLSDWDVHSCQNRSRLRIEVSRDCKDTSLILLASKEFHCVGHLNIDGGYSLLMTRTREPDGERYTCWVIQTYPERMSHRPWHQAYMLDTAQCGSFQGLETTRILQSAKMTIRTHSDKVEQYCDYRVNDRINDQTSNGKGSPGTSPVRKPYVRYDDIKGSAHRHCGVCWTLLVVCILGLPRVLGDLIIS